MGKGKRHKQRVKSMSLPKKDVRAKGVLPEAHVRLSLYAQMHGQTMDAVASDIINAHFLGADYKERLAHERASRMGLIGKKGDMDFPVFPQQKTPSAS